MTGKVKWFNDNKGYGFITDEHGRDVFVHYSDIIGIPILKENDPVSFDIDANLFSFKKERAINVTLITNKREETNMNENYIMLNGKRVVLTDEQIEKLGLKIKKEDCFTKNSHYFYIDDCGEIEYQTSRIFDCIDEDRHKVANYCTDESLMQQRAYHEALSRLLWRFSMQNDGDKIDWSNDKNKHYFIYYNNHTHEIKVDANNYWNVQGVIYFHTKEAAQRAINEIVLPFMKRLPDFVW